MKQIVKHSMVFFVGVSLLVLVVLPIWAQEKKTGSEAVSDAKEIFADPVRVMAGGEPMGKGITYPSPVLYDIDGDKRPELIIGDLPGYIRIAKKLPGDNPAAWGELVKLQSTEGKDIKFSNW